jgi:hypothetical protein
MAKILNEEVKGYIENTIYSMQNQIDELLYLQASEEMSPNNPEFETYFQELQDVAYDYCVDVVTDNID